MKKNFTEIEIPFGVKDSELYQFTYTIPDGYSAEIKDGKVIVKKKESEDERIRKALLRCCDDWDKGRFGCMAKEDVPAIRAYLERQKEQKPAKDTALQEAFINSKIDYTLEEKCDASDYAEIILPTSVIYGENEEEYKLHKIIEAAFIVGQKKKQQPAEWSEEDEKKIHFLSRLIEFQVKNDEYCFSDGRFVSKQEAIEMLKSLRPSWKPSEEQMKALKVVARGFPTDDPDAIDSLLTDLQKLL